MNELKIQAYDILEALDIHYVTIAKLKEELAKLTKAIDKEKQRLNEELKTENKASKGK